MADDDHTCRDILIVLGSVAAAYGTYRVFRSDSRPTAAPPEQDFVKEVVTSVTSAKGLQPGQAGDRGKMDRHKGFFIRRRTRAVGAASDTLRSEPGLATLKARIASEFDQVDQFVTAKIGTSTERGPLYGGADPASPPHLDLGDLLHQQVNDPTTTLQEAVAATAPNEIQARALRALDERRMRVIGIVWRGLALHDELWDVEADGHNSTLKEAEVSEILDRRLRSVERLQYTACGDVPADAMGSSAVKRRFLPPDPAAKATKGPWTDDHARTFELPSFPDGNALQSFPSGSLETDPSNTRFLQDPGLHWYKSRAADEFDWNDWPGTRVLDRPAPTPPVWQRLPPEPGKLGEIPGYGWMVVPALSPGGSVQPAEIIDALFRNRVTDWWLRSWLNSDGMLSAIHLEALLHARRRRDNNDDLFNGLRNRFVLALDDHLGVRTVAAAKDSIMAPGRTDFFDNGSIPYDDLQIGDQVLVDRASSLLALSVLASTWDYPTVLVTDIDSDPDGDALIGMLSRIRVQGFMTADLGYGALQRLLAHRLDAGLDAARHLVGLNFSASTGLRWSPGFEFDSLEQFKSERHILRVWNPYNDTWDPPGPWWLMIELADPMWRGAFANTTSAELVQHMPKAVSHESSGLIFCQGVRNGITTGAGFKNPPFVHLTDTIFIPLYEPMGGWVNYFEEKAAHPTEAWPSQLNPVRAEPSWFYLAEDAINMIRAIRPRNAPPAT